MEAMIHCFTIAISGHTHTAHYYTDAELKRHNGDWLALWGEKGWSNTSNLGDYPVLEGETEKQAFLRVSEERGWPSEGDLLDFR